MDKARSPLAGGDKQSTSRKVLHLYRTLQARPAASVCPGVHVRSFCPSDVDAYLALFRLALGELDPPVRPWNRHDFQRQLLAKPWWDPECCLLAYTGEKEPLAGSVTLAVYPTARGIIGAVHWLMVAPEFRRRGVGRLLLNHLEQRAWDRGVRLLRVETHARWQTAVQFYLRCGYRSG